MKTYVAYLYESDAHKKALLADVTLLDKCKILKLHANDKREALENALETMELLEEHEQHLKIYAIVEEKIK